MKVILAKNYDELSKTAAEIIANQVNEKPEGVLGLATGSTPQGTYKALIELYKAGKVDFKNIKTANLDEYCGLPKTNDQSYDYFMKDNLFNHINIDLNNTNIPNGTNPDVKAECERYEQVIKSLGGVDLQLLGIGQNGHIGFNEPADDFAAMTQCVDLQESTIQANARFFASIDEVPTKAISMGIGTIMAAKKILLVASGESKAESIYDTVCGKVCPQNPSSILQFHPDVTIVADEEALSKVLKECPQVVTK